jgi:hypothetical protein
MATAEIKRIDSILGPSQPMRIVMEKRSFWTIGRRVGVSLLTLVALTTTICAASIGGMWLVRRALAPISQEYLPEIRLGTTIERDLLNARVFFIYFATVRKPGTLDLGWKKFRQAKDELAKLHQLIEGSERLSWLQPDVDALADSVKAYEPVLQQVMDAAERNQNHGPEYAKLLDRWATLGRAMVEGAGKVSNTGTDLTAQSADDSTHSLRLAMLGVGISSGLAILLGGLLASLCTRAIGRLLQRIAADLRSGSKAVEEAAVQISSASDALSRGASQQAAAAEETSASAEEITATTKQNADGAHSVAQMVAESQSLGTEVGRAVTQMQQSIQAINSSTREVSKIIKAVDEIAFQTNILALNAAVEAARAGQAGLGFGVVAEEVRNLAQRCGAAATDTETLIEQSIASAQEGQSRLATLTAAFERSSQIQTAMKEQADQIALSSDEQSRGVNEIRRALLEINEVTQATAAHSQENAAAGERLTSQVKDFDAIISRLNVLVG